MIYPLSAVVYIDTLILYHKISIKSKNALFKKKYHKKFLPHLQNAEWEEGGVIMHADGWSGGDGLPLLPYTIRTVHTASQHSRLRQARKYE